MIFKHVIKETVNSTLLNENTCTSQQFFDEFQEGRFYRVQNCKNGTAGGTDAEILQPKEKQKSNFSS